MEKFKIGDKVRSKINHDLIGTISKISFDCPDYWYVKVDQIVTVTVDPETDIQINANNIEKIDEVKETKDMTSYRVGDIVEHPLYNESIIIDISRFESGHIEIVPLAGLSRGLPVLVSINNVKQADNKLIVSIEDYNKMANTIENLKKENIKLKEDAIDLVHKKWNLKKENVEMQTRLYAVKDKAKLDDAIAENESLLSRVYRKGYYDGYKDRSEDGELW